MPPRSVRQLPPLLALRLQRRPRGLGVAATSVSLVAHLLAAGGLVWVTWASTRGASLPRSVAIAVVAPHEAPTDVPQPAEQPPELEWVEPDEPQALEAPFQAAPADESRFDPQLDEVREPTRAIARWMSTPLSPGARTTGAPSGALAGAGGGEAPPLVEPAQPVVAVEPAAPAPADDALGLTHAVLVHAPDPTYPAASLRLREQGATLLRLKLDEFGAVRDVEVVRSSGSTRLDRAAAEGVRAWRFEPARRGDLPLATSVLHQVTFKLD